MDYLLQIDGIPGEANRPGFSSATEVHGLTISNGSLSITKVVDSTSPLLASGLAPLRSSLRRT